MALTDLTRISTSGIATGSTIDAPILRKDVSFRGSQVGVTSALFDSSDNALEFNDNVKIKLGNGGDLELYHNGADNYIDAKTGSLYFRNTLPTNTIFQTGNFLIKNQSNNQTVANFAPGANGGGLLYHENVLRFNTTSSGAVVTGILTATGFSGPLSNPSGISTFYDLRVTNNLTVEGTTSTLDTTLIGVDRVEVGANSNSIVGVAVTQSGTADIVNLFDGATKVVTVDDVGNIGLGTDVPLQKLHIEHDSFHQILLKRVGSGPSEAIFANAGNYTDIRNNASGLKFSVGSTPESKMVVRPVGVGIGTLIPRGDFHINDNNPALVLSESDAAVDNKYWRTTVNGQTWTWDVLNDSLTSGDDKFRMTRSGNDITAFEGRVSGSTWFNVSNSTQKVGIGSAIPENKLKINVSSGNDGMVVQNTSSANIAFIGARNGDATLQIGQYGSTASGNVFGIAAANLAFMYTTSYASTHPSALLIGNSSNKDVIFATNATARLSIKNDGKVLIGDGTTYDPQGMLHVVGDDNSNGPELYLQVPNNNTTDNIGALIFGNNVDKSIVKIQGVTHTANNTGDLTFHTSTTGTMSEKLRIDSLGRILYGLTSNFTGAKLQLNLGVGGSAINIFAASNDANAATLDLYKSRGTTPNNYTALQDGDFIGELRFRGTTGSSYVNGAVIQAKVNGTTGSGNDLPTDLIFRLQPDGSGNTGEVFRITSSGKVLVGDGNSVSPSRNLDVRGSGHQQILIGSTNNAGASLMVDGQGNGDGSGGLYCTFEAASDGHLKIRNYDPSKSIIFGTGSNTGSNDSVVIDSDGDLLIGTTTGTSDFHLTRTSGAVLHTIEATAAGGEALYKCLGKSSGNDAREVQFRYDSGADAHRIITANNIAIQLCTQNTPRLNIQGDGEVHLPTANYKFTENNFLSTSAATENGNTAQFSNAMTSMMGSYHSSNNTNGIMDFTDYKASDWTILEVYGKVNPNTAGSGAYSDPFYMTIYKGGGYDYGASSVVTTIFAVMHTPAARTFYSTGSGNNANDGITAVWYNGSSESVQFAHNNTNNAANYLRIKVPTGHFNTSYGMSFVCRIFKRF